MLRASINGEYVEIRYGIYPKNVRKGTTNIFIAVYNTVILDRGGKYPCDTFVSVNIDACTENNEFFYNINHDNVYRPYLDFLVDNGYAVDTFKTAISGFVEYPIYRLTEKFFSIAAYEA